MEASTARSSSISNFSVMRPCHAIRHVSQPLSGASIGAYSGWKRQVVIQTYRQSRYQRFLRVTGGMKPSIETLPAFPHCNLNLPGASVQ
jgi:hypothetical protein